MVPKLEKLIEEKQSLQTELVQIQAMLYLIDYYIAEELLRQVHKADENWLRKAKVLSRA